VPNWQPNWQDVRWNYAAADAAARQLDLTADELDSVTSARRQVAATATAEWRGTYRVRFEAQLSDTLGQEWDLSGTYREAAARVRQATQWAREEQARRERERERWRREKAQEDADRARAAARRRAAQEAAQQAAQQAP
jgi:hypothetical protein